MQAAIDHEGAFVFPVTSPPSYAAKCRGSGREPLTPDLHYAHPVASTPFRYQSPDEDSPRRLGFPFRTTTSATR